MKRLTPTALTALLAPVLIVVALTLQGGSGTAQEPVQLRTDAVPKGNTDTALGPTEGCVSVDSGDTFGLDIVVSEVQDLVAWELYFQYNPAIIDVVDADARMFLASNDRSSVTVLSQHYSDGRYFLGAADTYGPDSGSGVLARLTLHAVGPGISPAKIQYANRDADDDLEIGPRLTAKGGTAVGDVTGDGVFDGPTYHSLVAVDDSCDAVTPTPTLPPSPTPQAGGGSGPSATSTAAAGGGADGRPGGDPGGEGSNGSGTPGTGDTEGTPKPAVLARDGTPSLGDSNNSGPSSSGGASSGGGLPLWAMGAIAAAALVTAGGASVYLTARSGGRFWR